MDITDALDSQEQPVGRAELLDGDEIHQYGRGQAVVGGDTKPVRCGQSEDARVGLEEGNDGGDEATEQHADRVQDEAGHSGLVTQPANTDLAHRVQDADDGEDLGGLAVGDVQSVLHILDLTGISSLNVTTETIRYSLHRRRERHTRNREGSLRHRRQ